MKKIITTVLLTLILVALPASAGAFNHKQGATSLCVVSGTTVEGTGLPTGEVLNFVYLDGNGKYLGGYVIGYSTTDTSLADNTINRPAGAVASYAFTGKTWGNSNDPQFVVYSECAA